MFVRTVGKTGGKGDGAAGMLGGGAIRSLGGKLEFSNDWKIFFQWLENLDRFFQRLEKISGGFPMIGKIFRCGRRSPPRAGHERNHQGGVRFSVASQKFATHKVARKRDPPIALPTWRDALARPQWNCLVGQRLEATLFPKPLKKQS